MGRPHFASKWRKGRVVAVVTLVACVVLLAAAARATSWATVMTSALDRLMPGPVTTMWAVVPEPDAYTETYADATGAGANYVYRVDASTAEGDCRVLTIISFGGKALGEGYLEIEAKGITVDGHPVPLTPAEYELCELLARHRGQTMARDQIREAAFGWESDGEDAAISMHVSRARKKFTRLGADPIATVWGMGYRWNL